MNKLNDHYCCFYILEVLGVTNAHPSSSTKPAMFGHVGGFLHVIHTVSNMNSADGLVQYGSTVFTRVLSNH